MITKKSVQIVSVIVLIALLLFSAAADTEVGSCYADVDCSDPNNPYLYYDGCTPQTCYCNEETYTCFTTEEVVIQEQGEPAVVTGAEIESVSAPGFNASLLTALQDRLAELEAQQAAQQAAAATLTLTQEERITAVEENLALFQEQTAQQIAVLQNLQTELQQVGQVVQQEQQVRNELATGLAAVQKDIKTTEGDLTDVEEGLTKEQSFTRLIKGIFLVLLLIIAGLTVFYFVTGKAKQAPEMNMEVINYITEHIKQGKKFPQIKDHLLQAGWSEQDITEAYKQTIQHNVQKYKKQTGGQPAEEPNTDKKKIMTIAVVSLLLLIGAFILIRGVTTGQAIYFQSPQELSAAVENNLKIQIKNNAFYPLVDYAFVCVQVHDGDNWVYYKVLKTPRGHVVQPAPLPCTEDPSYDAAVKFTNWNSFNILTRKLTCENIKNEHAKQGVYVLPSTYVLPGFSLNPESDASRFCKALQECLTAEELTAMGIQC
ncbi:hypothetical protein J4228_02870 [Candidatus Woesearchaeota archaeon]|nr:hypothetical protein [Candidatus Woesearchaeota archaeon]